MTRITLGNLKKLRHMSRREVLDRLAERRRSAAERRAYRFADPKGGPSPSRETSQTTLAAQAAQVLSGCQSSNLDRLMKDHGPTWELFRKRTENLLESFRCGSWPILGQHVDLTGPVDWHRDPRTHFTWPRAFYRDVPLYDLPGQVDVKYVWEISRHQFLVTLAIGWRLAEDEQAALDARRLLLDWIEKNPCWEGVNWTSSLELAMRIVSWFWTLALLSEWPGWKDQDWAAIEASLLEHADYLEHHLSFHASPYNHLIGEATALYFLAWWLPAHERSPSWKKAALHVLAHFGPKQFHDDGFCVEQATGYHYFTLGFLLQAVHLARSEGQPIEELEQVVPKALRAGAAFMQSDGRWAAIGDVDSARAIPVTADDFWDFRSIHALGAVLFDTPELRIGTDQPGEELFWLLGCDGIDAWHRLNSLESKQSGNASVLKSSGYAVAGSRKGTQRDWLLFDAGPISHGLFHDSTPSAAHGHDDIFNVLFRLDGRDILVDSGMWSYNADRRWVDYFRSASAHNGLTIEGIPHAKIAGRLAWSNVCDPPHLDANLGEDVWLIHGRLLPRSGVQIERSLLGLPGKGIWIADSVELLSPQIIHQHWHFPGTLRLQADSESGGQTTYRFEGGWFAMWSADIVSATRLESAHDDSPSAWHAPEYGTRIPGQRLTCTFAPTSHLLALTYLGKERFPASVSLGGITLQGIFPEDDALRQPMDQLAGDLDAEVVWQVQLPEGGICIGGGVRSVPSRAGWKPLVGSGGWPASVYRVCDETTS